MARRSSKKKRRNRDAGEVQQLPWQRLKNPYSPIEVLPPEAVEAVHEASMEVLENLGIEFLLPRALDLLKAAGAHVDKETNLVRMDRGLVLEAVAKAPDCFKLTARNTDRYVEFGHNNINFDSVGGPPFSSDLDNGRRTGNFEDFSNFVKLTQALDVVHICGGVPIAPIELNAETRHLDCYYSFITQTDKVWHASGLGKQRMADAIDMLCIARGKTRDEITKEPGLFTTINSNSPRRFDGSMLEGLMEAAEFGQALSITPFTLSGAMSPATLAGSLVQQNAEALAGIAFAQIVAPSTPCIYGGFTSNVDMKTGSPAFGTPEYTKACLASGQMARRYGLPFRSSNTNASNAVDAQATYETSMSLWGSIMGHANIIHHGVGWLEGGLTASFEKAIIDAEMLQMMAEFMRPVDVSEKALAVDIIKEVEPGGHYFGTSQTMEIFETAFYSPILSDWRNFETWEENGSVTATERANKVWKQLLENYEEPALDPSIAEELKAFIAQRKKEEKVDVS